MCLFLPHCLNNYHSVTLTPHTPHPTHPPSSSPFSYLLSVYVDTVTLDAVVYDVAVSASVLVVVGGGVDESMSRSGRPPVAPTRKSTISHCTLKHTYYSIN